MARPTKLDDLVERRICDALKAGHSYAAAAKSAGISERTLHEWRELGRKGEGRYAQFSQRVDQADHEAEDRCVRELGRLAVESDDERIRLNALQYWLDRRRPATWGKPKGDDADERELTEDEVRAEWRKLTGTDWKP